MLSHLTAEPSWLRRHRLLWAALLLGLLLRILLWDRLPRQGLISDEAEYLASADWLALGRGFAWHLQYLWTRAPLYPLFVALHQRLFGSALPALFVTQSLLSLALVPLAYAVARRLGLSLRRAGVAALLTALSFPLATYSQLVLSETLFSVLMLTALLTALLPLPRVRRALLVGLLLGLATLTRGMALMFILPAAGWFAWHSPGRLAQRLALAALLAAAAAAVIAPWTLYASRTYGGLVVIDTTGAFNLALGARTAYDGTRRDAPTRNFVLALLDETRSPAQRAELVAGSCLAARADTGLTAALAQPVSALSQAQRQQLLNAEGLCLIAADPAAFVRKSFAELLDLFQINYGGDERLIDGHGLGRHHPAYVLALLLLDDTLYLLALPAALLGYVALPARRRPAAAMIALWLLYNLALAPLLFAINRFRVPLLPLLFVLAAALPLRRSAWHRYLQRPVARVAAALALLLWTIAATPYAALLPAGSVQPSYFGPYPASLAATRVALVTRSGYLAVERLQLALHQPDRTALRAAAADPALPAPARAVAEPLLALAESDAAAGRALLARTVPQPLYAWQTAVLDGALLRALGDAPAARARFTTLAVDDQNPTAWAWQWLPAQIGARIDVGDDDDLGAIDGFYAPEDDAVLATRLRWATDVSRLRFAGVGTGRPQQLCLNLAANWPADLTLPTVSVLVDGSAVGVLQPQPQPAEHCLALPALAPAATLVVELHSPTFVPPALDLVRRQGPQVGQLRRLAYQLDWAEVRP